MTHNYWQNEHRLNEKENLFGAYMSAKLRIETIFGFSSRPFQARFSHGTWVSVATVRICSVELNSLVSK